MFFDDEEEERSNFGKGGSSVMKYVQYAVMYIAIAVIIYLMYRYWDKIKGAICGSGPSAFGKRRRIRRRGGGRRRR